MGLPTGSFLDLSDGGAAGTAKKPDYGIGFGGFGGHCCLLFQCACSMQAPSPPRPGLIENQVRAGGGWRQKEASPHDHSDALLGQEVQWTVYGKWKDMKNAYGEYYLGFIFFMLSAFAFAIHSSWVSVSGATR